VLAVEASIIGTIRKPLQYALAPPAAAKRQLSGAGRSITVEQREAPVIIVMARYVPAMRAVARRRAVMMAMLVIMLMVMPRLVMIAVVTAMGAISTVVE